jgi:beta-lactamase regulating signal transducer with metallopeptidase domain
MRSLAPVPAWAGLACAALVVGLLMRAAWRTGVVGVALRRAHRTARLLPGTGPVVFVDDTDIYTVAGLPGRIVVGAALFDRLDPDDRTVVLAHERSHLRHRHHLYVHVVDVAAAANPFLRPLRQHVRYGIERWADEDAARSVGDRGAAAHALARTALTRAELRRHAPQAVQSGVLAAASLQVTRRVRALLAPAAPARTAHLVWMIIAALMVLAAGVASLTHIHALAESAEMHLLRH